MGTVDYDSDPHGDALILGLASRINGHATQGERRFRPLDIETLDGQT